jgi:hypothetical protein
MAIRLVVKRQMRRVRQGSVWDSGGSVKQEIDQRTGRAVLDKLKHLEPQQIALDETGVTAKHWSVRGGQKRAIEEQVSGHK